MAPDPDLFALADEIRNFPSDAIDRLHRTVERLAASDDVLVNAAVARDAYDAVCSEVQHDQSSTDFALDWLLRFIRDRTASSLSNRFSGILALANIVLTDDGTTTAGHSLPYSRPQSVISDDSLDENDPLWQQAVALDNRKLASQALEQWRGKLEAAREAYENYENPEQNAVADAFYRQNLGRRALWHLVNNFREIQALETHADEFRARKDAEVAIRQWTLASREQLLCRVHDDRILRNVLDNWNQKAAHVSSLEAMADDFSTRRAARTALNRMRDGTERIRHMEAQAVILYEGGLASRSLDRWHGNLANIQLNERKAEAAADYLALKHTLQTWREKTREKREVKVVAESRAQILATKYIRRWKAYTKACKLAKYKAAHEHMRRLVKMNLARAVLRLWREKVANLRKMETNADNFHDRMKIERTRSTAHGAIVAMFLKAEQTQEYNKEADLFYKKQLVDRLGLFGPAWAEPTRQILHNQKRADEYRSIRTASYAVGVLRNWRNHTYRNQRLAEDADALFQRNERRRAIAYLDKWKTNAAHKSSAPEEREPENMPPVTPAARRSQLLASTTPAYTPGRGLFSNKPPFEEVVEEEEE